MIDDEERLPALDRVRAMGTLGSVLLTVAAAVGAGVAGNAESVGATLAAALLAAIRAAMLPLLALASGAAGLLLVDRVEMDGGDGPAVQRKRLLCLALLGALAQLLFWQGDLLLPLALAGLLALRRMADEPIDLLKWALGCIVVQMAIGLGLALLPVPPFLTLPVWPNMAERLALLPLALLRQGLLFAPEAAAFALLGMAMTKGGFFSGQWTGDHYRATAIRGLLAGLLPLVLAALLTGGKPPMWLVAALVPFHIPATVGLAALMTMRSGGNALAALGRLSLSAYLAALLFGLVWATGAVPPLAPLAALGTGLAAGLALLAAAPLWRRAAGAGMAERLWRRLYGTGR